MMRAVFVPLALLLATLAGCIADQPPEPPIDDGDTTDDLIAGPETVTGIELLTNLPIEGEVNELTLRGEIAYVSGYTGSFIVNVSDPEAPEVLSQVPCRGIHVRTIQLEERLLMTLSYQGNDNCEGASSAGGIRLIDVTDPLEPVIGPQVALTFGSHTHTPYGDTGIIYNSAYNLYTSIQAHGQVHQHQRSEIINVTDWENPEIVKEFMFPLGSLSIGCHDIWPEPERDRAICAAITETQIWDTTDPLSPRIVSTIHNPLLTIHHTATTTADGELLMIGEEWTGAIGPGCFDESQTAPMGSIWFYDISDPRNPEMLSYYAPPHQGPDIPCTAHNFNVIEGHDVLVAAFFRAGTVLIDFSDPENPTTLQRIAPEGTDVWASYYHNGHVFTGDRGRGLDVFRFTDAD